MGSGESFRGSNKLTAPRLEKLSIFLHIIIAAAFSAAALLLADLVAGRVGMWCVGLSLFFLACLGLFLLRKKV